MRRTAFFVGLAFVTVLSSCKFGQPKPDGSGTIECTQIQVACLVGGKLQSLKPQEGDRVKKGDEVARIDAADYEFKRDELRAARAQAEAQWDLVTAGSREEDVQRARDQVREAQAGATAAQADLKRIEEVFAKKSASQKQMDDAKAQAERSAAARAGAEQTLAKLVRGSRNEEIRAAKALLEQATARLAQAEKAVADCVVTAPADGVVTVRSREEGEIVAPGSVLVTLSLLDSVWLSIYVPETRLGRVKLGQKATVRIDGDPKRYEGKVTFVSPEAEFTPKNVQTPDERAKLVYRVKIALANPEGVFKPGMPADGYLEMP